MKRKIKLAMYEMLDDRFEEWLSYSEAMQKYFIKTDITIFKRAIFDSDDLLAISGAELQSLLNKFKTVSKTDKIALKNIYLDFIERVSRRKPYRYSLNPEAGDSFEDNLEPISPKQEYKVATEQQQEQNLNDEDNIIFEERSEELAALSQKSKLSAIEKEALKYLNPLENPQEQLFLKYFTSNGIKQITNRAFYKLYYYRIESQ